MHSANAAPSTCGFPAPGTRAGRGKAPEPSWSSRNRSSKPSFPFRRRWLQTHRTRNGWKRMAAPRSFNGTTLRRSTTLRAPAPHVRRMPRRWRIWLSRISSARRRSGAGPTIARRRSSSRGPSAARPRMRNCGSTAGWFTSACFCIRRRRRIGKRRSAWNQRAAGRMRRVSGWRRPAPKRKAVRRRFRRTLISRLRAPGSTPNW